MGLPRACSKPTQSNKSPFKTLTTGLESNAIENNSPPCQRGRERSARAGGRVCGVPALQCEGWPTRQKWPLLEMTPAVQPARTVRAGILVAKNAKASLATENSPVHCRWPLYYVWKFEGLFLKTVQVEHHSSP